MSDTQPIEFGVYLPQVKLDFQTICERVQIAEELGYDTAWFYDHLYSPGAPDVPDLDGWTLVSALAPLTHRIRLGQLVLCNGFRHPALLARQAVTLDVISGGRLELGLGTGSNLTEFREFGLPCPDLATRSEQLDEALHVIELLCTQSRSSFRGKHYRLDEAPTARFPVQQPHPRLTIGGGGVKRTLPLVARHADVWNCPTYSLAELEAKATALRRECERQDRDPASLLFGQQAVVLVVDREEEREKAWELARSRFGGGGWGLEERGLVGTPSEVIDRLGESVALGFRNFALFFHDRGKPETLERFAKQVMVAFR